MKLSTVYPGIYVGELGCIWMIGKSNKDRILIVDDEWDSPIVKAVVRNLEEDGWVTSIVKPTDLQDSGAEFEAETLYAIDELNPNGVLLDVRLGEYKEDQFKGLEILQKIVSHYPDLPVLMFTQYTHGPERETAVRGTLQLDSPVDFIDKLASPQEVVLRLRRLIGRTPPQILIADRVVLDIAAKVVKVQTDDDLVVIGDIQGMKFEIFRELASTWYKSPGQLVPFSRLERYSEGEEARASLRVRIREIKVTLGNALGIRFGAGDFIINVRDQGYRLVPPKTFYGT
jgi:DNA-binding response OmpR family regulator